MKRLAVLAGGLSFISSTTLALAQVPINITPPSQGISPTTNVGTVVSNALTIIFVVAALVVLFMLVLGAFQWITSGGDKEAVGKARSRIIAALVGLAILALAFLIVNVVGQILNIQLTGNLQLPTLQSTR
ncbi:hypothetical protein HY389_02190 [Candidatus Daviesbacteria bacterium]|nr:hypothetical protein [Candidatus Daviesbacteria bacterium]